jgi:hypothetical protein
MSAPSGAAGRVVRNVHHGSQVVPPGTIGPGDTALRSQAVEMDAVPAGGPDEPVAGHAVVFETPFDYLFDKLAAEFPAHHLDDTDPATTVARLKALGTAMIEEKAPPGGELQTQGNSRSRRSTRTGASSSTTTSPSTPTTTRASRTSPAPTSSRSRRRRSSPACTTGACRP